MALLVPYARFLRRVFQHSGPFGVTLTLGRQENLLTAADGRDLLGLSPEAAARVAADPYADTFLREACGASRVDALDYSGYQGAARVWDLNVPVPEAWYQQYDAIVDGGTLEHVFQAPLALASLMQMLRPGGRLFIASPTNNHCGHGFYQFSPEFFYRALAPEQGFSVQQMVLFTHAFPGAELSPRGRSYLVEDPARVGGRVQLQSSRAALLFVEARRDRIVRPFQVTPQQSDYVVLWEQSPDASSGEGQAGPQRRSLVRRLGRPMAIWLSRFAVVRGIVQRWGHASLRNRRSFRPMTFDGPT